MTRPLDRVPVSLPVIGRAPQFLGTALQGTARYVSEGGLVLEFPVEVVRGTVLRVVLQTSQGPLDAEGSIVWSAVHEGVIQHGLTFPEPKGPDFVKLPNRSGLFSRPLWRPKMFAIDQEPH